MQISIHEEIGTRCLIKEDGQKIYNLINPVLNDGQPVILDFSNVTQFASPFFNFSIGQIIINSHDPQLIQLIKFINLNEIGKLVVDRVIENAKKYQSDFNYENILGQIIKEQASESDE